MPRSPDRLTDTQSLAPTGRLRCFGWILVAAGFVLDLGSWFGSGREAQRRNG